MCWIWANIDWSATAAWVQAVLASGALIALVFQVRHEIRARRARDAAILLAAASVVDYAVKFLEGFVEHTASDPDDVRAAMFVHAKSIEMLRREIDAISLIDLPIPSAITLFLSVRNTLSLFGGEMENFAATGRKPWPEHFPGAYIGDLKRASEGLTLLSRQVG